MSRWARSSFWTIAATVAGVIGAAAAVYPLINSEQQYVHLAYDAEIDSLKVETLSEPVILTGNWYVKVRRSWWSTATLRTGDAIQGTDWKERRILASERKLLFLEKRLIERGLESAFGKGDEVTCDRRGGAKCRDFALIACAGGDVEVGVEFKSRTGVAWARKTLPYCLQH